MKQIASILLFVTFFSISCTESKSTEEKEAIGQIVFIFDSIPDSPDTLTLVGGQQMIREGNAVTFRPINRQDTIFPVRRILTDTIIVNLKSDYLFVHYRINPLVNYITFLLHKGDTVLVCYQNEVPFLAVKNREVYPFDINFDFYRWKRYNLVEGFPAISHLFNNSPFLRFISAVNRIPFEDTIQDLRSKITEELEDERQWLDSLRQNSLISELAFDYFRSRNEYWSLVKRAQSSNITQDEMRSVLQHYCDSLFRNDIFGFYSASFQIFASNYYLRSNNFQLRYAFGSLISENLVTGRLRQDILLRWLSQIVNQNTVDVGRMYVERVMEEITDSLLLQNIFQAYKHLLDDEIMNSQNMELIDSSGHRTTFEVVLEKHRNKIVYVSFWASWCAPCIAGMPYAELLREEYKDKDIVFIYLAFNDEKNRWKTTKQQVGLSDFAGSYFIINSRTAPMIADLDVRTVPRYLLYNRRGELVHRNAPGPRGDEIRELLNLLLRED